MRMPGMPKTQRPKHAVKIIYETISVSTYLLEKVMNESQSQRGNS